MWQPLLIPRRNVFIGPSFAFVAPIFTTLLNKSFGALSSGIDGGVTRGITVDIWHLWSDNVVRAIIRGFRANPWHWRDNRRTAKTEPYSLVLRDSWFERQIVFMLILSNNVIVGKLQLSRQLWIFDNSHRGQRKWSSSTSPVKRAWKKCEVWISNWMPLQGGDSSTQSIEV